MSQLLPVFLKLKGQRVLLVGGGTVAAEKLQKLSLTDAFVDVVSPVFSEAVRTLATKHSRITLHQRVFENSDAHGRSLIFSAVDRPEVTRQVKQAAAQKNVLVNAADIPEDCDFFLTGSVSHGTLSIAISSGGQNPGLVREVRKFLEQVLPSAHDSEINKFRSWRQHFSERFPRPQERLSALRRMNELLGRWYFPRLEAAEVNHA